MIAISILEKIIIDQYTPFIEALKKLDDGGQQILLVVDKDKRLRGVLTDGDFRRHILKNQSLNIPVKEIMNTGFLALSQHEKSKAQEILKSRPINHVPIVDDQENIVDLVTSLDFIRGKTKEYDLPVVIMAGGKGTRLSPLTKIIPKPLMPVGDQTMLEAILENFESNGFKKFYVIVNHKKELIKSYFIENSVPHQVRFIEEEEFLGTAGGLYMLKDTLESTFVLSNCDIIAKLNYGSMLDWHFEHQADLTIVGVRKRVDIPYGVINVNQENYVISIAEKPYYNFMIISGVYVLEPSLFKIIPDNKFYAMDQLIEDCLGAGKKVTCYPLEDGWFDMGQFEEYKGLLKQFGIFNV